MQRVPYAAQSVGSRAPVRTPPHDALGVLDRAQSAHVEASDGIELAVLLGEFEPAVGQLADPAPGPVGHPEHVADRVLRRGVARPPHGPHVLVLHLVPARLQLPYGHEDALQQIQRLEAGDHDGHVVAGGDRLVLAPAHHRAHVPGGEEGLHLAVGVVEQGGHGRRYEDVTDQHREVGQPEPGRVQHRHRVRGRCRLEADGEEHDLAVGVFGGQAYGVHRGVDHAYIRAPRPQR